MDLHYSQTNEPPQACPSLFESPMDLHYSQTPQENICAGRQFESPMDLHYSQTNTPLFDIIYRFESPMDLHYSQTLILNAVSSWRLNPLWIYTTLKLSTIGNRRRYV